jgi:hypothetical protein
VKQIFTLKHIKKVLLVLAAGLMSLAPMSASAAVRGGVVIVHRPFWGSYWGPGWGPGWGPYPYPGYYYDYPNIGTIKLDTKVKDAQVFINGAYAGTTHENKSMHLRPGSYNVEIREDGRTQFAERIYVASGKTLHLHPEL